MNDTNPRTITGEVTMHINGLVRFAAAIGEMKENEFDNELMGQLKQIDDMARAVPSDAANLKRYCFDALSSEVDLGMICRHARHKPYGYAGDFLLIDGIYDNRTCSEGCGELWDKFFLRQPAAQAVRNRKTYILDILSGLHRNGEKIRALSLASGPCREIYEFLREKRMTGDHHFFCVDLDERAIAYARALLGRLPGAKGMVQIETDNVFRFRPARSLSENCRSELAHS